MVSEQRKTSMLGALIAQAQNGDEWSMDWLKRLDKAGVEDEVVWAEFETSLRERMRSLLAATASDT
jgi:hypothetical protein